MKNLPPAPAVPIPPEQKVRLRQREAKLTEGRLKLLQAVVAAWTEDPRPYTYRELCERSGYRSSSTVYHHAQVLQLLGLLDARERRRGVVPTPAGVKAVLGHDLCPTCSRPWDPVTEKEA